MKRKILVSILALGLALSTFYLVNHFEEPVDPDEEQRLTTFSSEDEMLEYVTDDPSGVGSTLDSAETDYAVESGRAVDEAADTIEVDEIDDTPSGDDTVVQVAGIDEPDMVKTDGEKLYYHGQWRDGLNTSIIDMDDLEIDHNFTESGELLLHEETLIMIQSDKVLAYDIEEKQKNWEEEFEHSIDTVRLREDELVVVTTDGINYMRPCPIKPHSDVSIPCNNIVRPRYNIDTDSTYTFMTMDVEEGEIKDDKSFVGDRNSEFYVTEDEIYFTYTGSEERSEVFFEFLIDHSSIDEELRDDMERVKNYDLSEQATNTEIDILMEEWAERNEEDAEEVAEELEEFLVDRKREHHWTTIGLVDEELELQGEKRIPGEVNDRMDMHRYDGELYTVSRIDPGYSMFSNRTTDLYRIDEGFDSYESVEEITEESRPEAYFQGGDLFIESHDHIVNFDLESFEQVNTFGEEAGFLHSVDDETLVGVGRSSTEDHGYNLTVSVYDRGTGEERDGKVTDRRFTQVMYDLQSFQFDMEEEMFFIPTSGEGVVFDYSEGLEQHSLNISRPSRSFFLEDIVVVGRGEIKKFETENFEEVERLEIPSREYRTPVVREEAEEDALR